MDWGPFELGIRGRGLGAKPLEAEAYVPRLKGRGLGPCN